MNRPSQPLRLCVLCLLISCLSAFCLRAADADSALLQRIREKHQTREAMIRSLHFVERWLEEIPQLRLKKWYETEWIVDRDRYLKISKSTDIQGQSPVAFDSQSYDGEYHNQLLYWDSAPGRVKTIQRKKEKPIEVVGLSALYPMLGLDFPGLSENLSQLFARNETEITTGDYEGTKWIRLRFPHARLGVPNSADHRVDL